MRGLDKAGKRARRTPEMVRGTFRIDVAGMEPSASRETASIQPNEGMDEAKRCRERMPWLPTRTNQVNAFRSSALDMKTVTRYPSSSRPSSDYFGQLLGRAPWSPCDEFRSTKINIFPKILPLIYEKEVSPTLQDFMPNTI